MTLKYESEILFDLMKRDGDDAPSDVLPYESELKEKYLQQVEGAYPKLQDYRSEWLNYNLNGQLPSEFPMETLSNVTDATVDNVVPYAYGSAILKGNTKYRDIDTGDILDTFDETKNLELLSVKMPVLTTSNEDGTKTNILTVNEEVTLRGIGNVQDTLDCLTWEVIERIGEIVLDGSQNMDADTQGIYIQLDDMKKVEDYRTLIICDKLPVFYQQWDLPYIENGISGYRDEGNKYLGQNWLYIKVNNSINVDEVREWLTQNPITVQYQLATESIKTLGLSCINEQGESVTFTPIEGTMHVSTSSQTLPPLLDMSVPVEATTQNLMSFANIEEEK